MKGVLERKPFLNERDEGKPKKEGTGGNDGKGNIYLDAPPRPHLGEKETEEGRGGGLKSSCRVNVLTRPERRTKGRRDLRSPVGQKEQGKICHQGG